MVSIILKIISVTPLIPEQTLPLDCSGLFRAAVELYGQYPWHISSRPSGGDIPANRQSPWSSAAGVKASPTELSGSVVSRGIGVLLGLIPVLQFRLTSFLSLNLSLNLGC